MVRAFNWPLATRLAEPADFAQPRFGGVNHLGERAELADQRFRQRFYVAPRQRAEQHHFKEFVVAQRIGAGAAKTHPQSFAMAVIMRLIVESGLARLAAGLGRHRAPTLEWSAGTMPRGAGFATADRL